MSRRDIDDVQILAKYRMRSLNPSVWEDVDHEAEGGLVGDVTEKDEPDPLGIGSSVV